MRHGRSIANLALAGLAVAPMLAHAQAESFLGPSVGAFFPSDRTVRDELGDTWLSFGASRVKIDPNQKRSIAWDWNAFSKNGNGNKVFMLAATLGLTLPMGDVGAMTRPYFAVRGGLSYVDYAVGPSSPGGALAARVSGKRVGFNANAEVGVNVGHNFNISARYDLFPEYEGLRFSGFSLAAKWGIARF